MKIDDAHIDWRDAYGYYYSDKHCCICGTTNRTGSEPRFGYVVCQRHSKLSPMEINKYKVTNENP